MNWLSKDSMNLGTLFYHPQLSIFWLIPFFIGIGALFRMIEWTKDGVSLAEFWELVALWGLLAISVDGSRSYFSAKGERSLTDAVSQGIWFGCFTLVLQLPLHMHATIWSVWATFALSGGVYGAVKYVFRSNADIYQGEYYLPVIDGESRTFWAGLTLAVGFSVSLSGVELRWTLLVMLLCLATFPGCRRLKPEFDVLWTNWLIKGLSLGLALAAAYVWSTVV